MQTVNVNLIILIFSSGAINTVSGQSQQLDLTSWWSAVYRCWTGGPCHHPEVRANRVSKVACWRVVRVRVITLLHSASWYIVYGYSTWIIVLCLSLLESAKLQLVISLWVSFTALSEWPCCCWHQIHDKVEQYWKINTVQDCSFLHPCTSLKPSINLDSILSL